MASEAQEVAEGDAGEPRMPRMPRLPRMSARGTFRQVPFVVDGGGAMFEMRGECKRLRGAFGKVKEVDLTSKQDIRNASTLGLAVYLTPTGKFTGRLQAKNTVPLTIQGKSCKRMFALSWCLREREVI